MSIKFRFVRYNVKQKGDNMELKKIFSKDGFTNIMRGLKGNRDITKAPSFSMQKLITANRSELNQLYSGNWLARKVVDIPVNDAFKEGITFISEDTAKLEVFEKALKGFKVDKKFKQAGKWGRLFGGALLIIVSDDDEMDQPFNIDNMKKGDLRNIIVLDNTDVYSTIINRNPLDYNYLEPEYYHLTRTSTAIHHTRVIRFDGEETTNDFKEFFQGFGLSIFESGYPSIMNASMSPDLLINLLAQSNTDVFGINGLNEAVAGGHDELVIKRLQTIQDSKSIFNGIALDSEDTYNNIAKNFAGLKDMNTEFYQIVAGAYDIPLTRLLGTAEAGLGSTGEGSLKNYYDNIKSLQGEYEIPLTKIFKVLQQHLFGEDIGLTFSFNSLFQLTDVERATLNKTKAETDTINFNNGGIDRLDIMERLVQDETYPSITAERLEQEKKDEEELNSLDGNFNENE